MLRRIDSSERLSLLIARLSTAMARNRGLPLLVGTVVMLLSFISFGLILLGLVAAEEASQAWLWLCLPITLLHLALFAVFTGVMLAVPLGEGYRDTE